VFRKLAENSKIASTLGKTRLKFMPIKCATQLRPATQEQFAALDYCVMQHAFACQNELGRLCDEVIYHNDLAARLKSANLGSVVTEAPLFITHRSFSKIYYLDLVVAESVIYELKTATHITPEHKAQLLNYLLLGGINHGKLINFKPNRVQSRFVNTTLNPLTRRNVELVTKRWQEIGEWSKQLREIFTDLLKDWGGFLELALYREALIHLFGGEDTVMRMVPVTRNGLSLGQQRFFLLSPQTAFRLTALSEDDAHFHELHLRTLLQHTPLQIVQWLNMTKHQVHFITLSR
jgi:GxxExxY protein